MLSVMFAVGIHSGVAQPAISSNASVGPTITTQPANTTVLLGHTASFVVVASGTAPLHYQWYKNSAAVTGATSSKYTTPPTTGFDDYSIFTVTVSNSISTAYSSNAHLTLAFIPTITSQPSDLTVTAPGIAEFTVDVGGTPPLTIQWYRNNVAIPGATNSTYTKLESAASDNGSKYFVIVKNAYGRAISNPTTLTVNPSTTVGTYPIVGTWAGTATISNPVDGTFKSQAVAAFSQTSYGITVTVVYTDDQGIPTVGAGIASLNGSNVYLASGGDPTFGIAGGFSSDLLTLKANAVGDDASTGSGTLTLSADKQTLTGTGVDSFGDTITWNLTRQK